MAPLLRSIAAGLLGLVAAGCSLLPDAKPDPTRFYVLTTAPAAEVTPAVARVTLALRPVEVAGYLRNPPMVVRRGEHEVEFRDFARWGETLEQGIARVLAEELRARGVGVTSAVSRMGVERQLQVRVLACEGTASGAVVFRAAWEMTRPGEPAVGATQAGEFRAEGLSWDGKSEALLAAGLSRAVAALADHLAVSAGAR